MRDARNTEPVAQTKLLGMLSAAGEKWSEYLTRRANRPLALFNAGGKDETSCSPGCESGVSSHRPTCTLLSSLRWNAPVLNSPIPPVAFQVEFGNLRNAVSKVKRGTRYTFRVKLPRPITSRSDLLMIGEGEYKRPRPAVGSSHWQRKDHFHR